MSLNRGFGIVAIVAGGVILSIAANGGQLVTCGKWTGCTTHTDALQNFGDLVLFIFAGGIGLIGLGIFLLVPKHEGSKPPFGKSDQGMI